MNAPVSSAVIRLQREPFEAGVEVAALCAGRTDIGAVVTFTGICRGEENGAPIAALTLEHYPEMAQAEIERQVEAAMVRWSLKGVRVVHRFGRIEPGEDIVLVVTASSHRQNAFAAAEFLMDYLKTRAPFWKEVEQAGRKSWIDAKASDESATARWEQTQTLPPAGAGKNLPPPLTGEGRGGGEARRPGETADTKAGRRRP
jgi:molybdopterin synthase catalytic subunit